MTQAETLTLCEYIDDLAQRMCLRDWTIYLHDDPCEPEYNAKILACAGRKMAYINLSPDWPTFSLERRRHTLVHELVHLHETPATDVIRLDLRGHVSKALHKLLWDIFSRAIEYMVDGLADAIAPLMPLPPDPSDPSDNSRFHPITADNSRFHPITTDPAESEALTYALSPASQPGRPGRPRRAFPRPRVRNWARPNPAARTR